MSNNDVSMGAGPGRTLATVGVHAAALVLAVFWTAGVYYWLVRDSTAISEWPVWLFALVAVLPIIAASCYSFRACRHRILTIALAIVETGIVLAVAMVIIGLSRAFDGCPDRVLGEGVLYGKEVSFGFCYASFHEAEEWVEVYDPLELRRLERVGANRQYSRRLGVISAREADPIKSARSPTFASRPVLAKAATGNTVDFSFSDGHSSRIPICREDGEFVACHR